MRFSWLLVLALACGSEPGEKAVGEPEVEPTEVDEVADYFSSGCEAARLCGADAEIEEAYCYGNDGHAMCTIDEAAMGDCLTGEWTCVSVDGVASVEPPSSCDDAVDCPVTDTGSTSYGDDDDDDDVVAVVAEFDDDALASGVMCSGPEVTFAFEFLGEASSGFLDLMDTANRDAAYGPWNDTHTLDASPSALGTTLGQTLETSASLVEWIDGVSTAFRCDYHFDQPDTMSYIVRAYDLSDDLSDCVAWGEAPNYFISGQGIVNARPREAEFVGCRVAAPAR